MAKHFPLIFLAVLAGLCVWAIVRSIRQSLGKPPTWPETDPLFMNCVQTALLSE
jgi:hypothetical protein